MPPDLEILEPELEELEPVEGAEPIEAGADAEAKPKEGEADKPPVTSLFQGDGKKLDPQVSATLSKIKAESPELGKLLSKAVYRVAEFDREFPGGMQEVREVRDKVEEFGGIEGIEQKLAGAAEMDGLAKQYMGADPAFVQDLIDSSPEAFAALAPIVFNKYAETSPDGFAAYVGRIFYGDMQKAGIPLMMMRLADTIADNPRAMEVYKTINGYLGAWKELSDRPMPEAKPKPAERKPDNTSKREEELRSREWKTDWTEAQRGIVNPEYTKALAGRKPNTEEKAQVLELFQSRAAKLATQYFKGWPEKAQKYIASNDKEGYLRYMKSIYRRVVPEAMQSAVNSTMRGRVAPKIVERRPNGQQPGAVVEGFKPVATEPSTWDIDFGRTTQSMLFKNTAVLKNGSKVSWK